MSSGTVIFLPQIIIAPEGHSSAHLKQVSHSGILSIFRSRLSWAFMGESSPSGQVLIHREHLLIPIHLDGYTPICCFGDSPSGLLHHKHLRGQPLKKISVLIPGPSCIVYFCMLVTRPYGSSFFVRFICRFISQRRVRSCR